MQPNAGKVRVFGGDPTNPENRMRTGAMLQVGRVPETLRVREHIDLFSTYYAKPLPVAEILGAAGLEKLSDRKFGDLSGGQTAARAIRAGHLRRSRSSLSRRTDGRPRRGSAPHVVGRNSTHGRSRQDRSAHDALPAGSRRARRPHRRHQSRRNHRRGHSGRNQGEDQRKAHSLHHQSEPAHVARRSRV